MKHLLHALFITALIATTAHALTSAEAFTQAPRHVLGLLDSTTRLDMLDYYRAGRSTASANRYGGRSRILSLNESTLTVELTPGTSVQIAPLPTVADTLVAFITTALTPVPDSRLNVYDAQWNDVTAKLFTPPGLQQWLTAAGKKQSLTVEDLIPFMLISYEYLPEQATLRLTNNTSQFLTPDDSTTITPYLLHHIDYHWAKGRFK